MSIEARSMDICSEAGEVAKEVLAATEYGRRPFQAAAAPGLAGEIGDLLYSVLALAAEVGIDPEAALDAALDKYQKRLAGGSMGSGGSAGSVGAAG
ncbi:nucleotide pyrophosphohydrolase [Phytoactinopolyspora sp. XMNu-373]|uniref:Nucleotide pyrophosphohydrolase n=2 Tax=Phytoactinopolyspora mesophila TaxID=2650750 RepID=A0A7K3LZ15_9ACTN|nr:nucleotide pyrophosphohydrolase [Phytoactinopolyspora mesophila]